MAQKTIVTLTDDIDGSDAAETVSLGLDGTLYEIDLTTENAEKLRHSLAAWITASRRSGRTSAGKATVRRTVSDVDPAAVRAWAGSNGIAISSRGRVPSSVVEQFRAAGD